MPLFRRCDGELLKNVDPIRRMMPMVMGGRNQSIIYHMTQWEIANARAWLRVYNRNHGDRSQATLFHMLAYACIRTLLARPGLNRFVSGGRIYQRKGLWLSFAIKMKFNDDAPLTTVKLSFSENDRFDECVDRMTNAVKTGRSGDVSPIEREVRFLTKLPSPLLRMIVAAGSRLDRFNLLPASLIEPDPMFTSLFLANLGSIRIDNAYHHLYEYGTCSLFGVVGGARKALVTGRNGRPAVREVLQVYWSFDERVNDGFYCMESLEMARRIIEDPEHYIERDAVEASTYCGALSSESHDALVKGSS
jgi:pyruvate/2-oxoglutarate dehydrogenase complex dihydrolipoamide acyltransferase (E2) component